MRWELNINDDTVDLFVYGVIYSASTENFNINISEVKGHYFNDGLQQEIGDKEVNILDENSDFDLDDIVSCFEGIPHNKLEITIEEEE